MDNSGTLDSILHLLVIIAICTILAGLLNAFANPASGASSFFTRADNTWKWAISNAYGTGTPSNQTTTAASQATTGTGSVVTTQGS